MRALIVIALILCSIGMAQAWRGAAERSFNKAFKDTEAWMFTNDKGDGLPAPNQGKGAFGWDKPAAAGAFAVVVGASFDKVSKDAIAFATKNPNLGVLVVDFASLKKGGPQVNVPKLPENLIVHVTPVDQPNSAVEDSVTDEGDKGIPNGGTKKAGASIKNALLPTLIELKSKLQAKAWAQKYPDSGAWHYWGDAATYPNHHVSLCTTVKCAPLSHSKEDGQKCAYMANQGTYTKGCNSKNAAYRQTLVAVWDACVADPICV